jgi:hypothetical protein
MLKTIYFSVDFKKLHYKSGFLGPEVWARRSRYAILMDGLGHVIGVLFAYPIYYHPYE